MLRAELAPLGLKATASYIAARLRVAGGAPTEVFTKDAVGAIYEASRGIPRIIGVICENALLAGYAAQKKPVDKGSRHRCLPRPRSARSTAVPRTRRARPRASSIPPP